MNHYYKKPVYISGKSLGDTRLSGTFSTKDKNSFIESITELKQVKVKEEVSNTVLY